MSAVRYKSRLILSALCSPAHLSRLVMRPSVRSASSVIFQLQRLEDRGQAAASSAARCRQRVMQQLDGSSTMF